MTTDHAPVQELLAGLALHALDPHEMQEAERRIATHVLACDECGHALEVIEAAAGDLALAATPRIPPAILEQRIRRGLVRRRPPPRWVALMPAAASFVVAAGLLFWNTQLTSRIGHAEAREATSAELLTAVSHPASKVLSLPLRGVHPEPSEAPAELAAAVIPGRSVLYVFGAMPPPGKGGTYTLWLRTGGRYVNVAEFVPERGTVVLAVRVNPSRYERLLVTEEKEEGRESPSQNRLAEISL
jgi:hypothetical protein